MDKPTARAEHARLAELRRHAIVGTPPEASFEVIAQGAARLVHAPVALVTFIDAHRQWIKAAVGTDLRDVPRELSFCVHALASPDPLVIPDTTLDERARNNPLVTGAPHVRFYAGAPIVSGGLVIGTVCVLDTRPRQPTGEDLRRLVQLARITANVLEHRTLGTPYRPITVGPPVDFLVTDGQGCLTRLGGPMPPGSGVPWDPVRRNLTEVLPVRWLDDRHEAQMRGALASGTPWTGRVGLAGPEALGMEAMLTVLPAAHGGNAALYVWNYQD